MQKLFAFLCINIKYTKIKLRKILICRKIERNKYFIMKTKN